MSSKILCCNNDGQNALIGMIVGKQYDNENRQIFGMVIGQDNFNKSKYEIEYHDFRCFQHQRERLKDDEIMNMH